MVVHKRATKETYAHMVEKVRDRMESWKQRCLSKAWRRTLVQSVLAFFFPMYTMRTSLLPVTTCKQLDRFAWNFLWGGIEDSNGNHLVSWKSVSMSKERGGLGLRSAGDNNLGMIAKLVWAVENNSTSLASTVLRRKYVRPGNPLVHARKGAKSNVWRGILKAQEVLNLGRRWLSGTGQLVDFWRDWWVGDGPLIRHIPGDVSSDLQPIRVSSFITHDKEWNFQSVQHVLPPETLKEIQATPIPKVAIGVDRQV